MEKLATDIYSFEQLLKNGFTYVDKTAQILPLVDMSIGKQFFLARPRRFGKSLLVSTLKCLFEGRRELFKGLAIEDKWDWTKTWPVLHLDMGSCQADDITLFEGRIQRMLAYEAKRLGLAIPDGMDASSQFAWLIHALAAKSKQDQMVLLVDEYDKPLLGLLGHPEIESVRSRLKQFYSVIKTYEGLQRFTLITGVSKFSKVSIFSDLNNLNDFSMDARAATLLGYTHEEVKRYFPESLAALGAKLGLDDAGTFTELTRWYDGYRFEENAEPVFNPVSVGKCLTTGKMKPYWFETGTPTFLIDLMAENPVDLSNVEIPETMFSVYEPSRPALMPLLYQTGYLTIKECHRSGSDYIYHLGMPNLEVSKAFSESLSLAFSHLDGIEHSSLLAQMVEALEHDDVNDMLDALSCFFANIPANITVKREKYYQSLFYAVFVLIGARTHAECWTNRGRVDAMVETPCGIYIFEFKLGSGAHTSSDRLRGSLRSGDTGNRPLPAVGADDPGGPSLAAEALAQIKAKGYAEKYMRQGKKVTLIGAAFDADMRNLSDRQVEELEK